MAFCSNCGAEISDDAKFCPKCGAPVKAQTTTANDATYQKTAAEQTEGRYIQKDINRDTSNGSSDENGHGLAIASLVCGIIGVVCWFFGYASFLSIVLGIIGLVLAGNAKKAGNDEGIRTAGFVLSLIGLIGGIIVFVYLIIALAFVGATVHGLLGLL